MFAVASTSASRTLCPAVAIASTHLPHSSMFRQVRQATTTSKSEKMTTHYEMEERGTLHTLDYRVYFSNVFFVL
jgi:hypothetical protein